MVVDERGGPPADAGIPLPPHTPRKLYTGQPHMELRGLKGRPRAGDFTRLTLTFREAGTVTFSLQVLNRTWETEEPASARPALRASTAPRTSPSVA